MRKLKSYRRSWYTGGKKKAVNAMGQTTSYSYDDMGNLKQVKYYDKTEENYTYDEVGNMLTYQKRDGTTYYYKYDMLNNKTEEGILFDGEPRKGSENAMVLYDYYPNGKIYKETYPDKQTITYTYNDCWQLSVVTDKEGNSTRYERDAAGNVKTETKPLNTISQYEYDKNGNLKVVRDAKRQIIEDNEYNALNQLVSSKNALENITGYKYDKSGFVAYVTQCYGTQNAVTTGYDYDGEGRLVEVTDAEDGLSLYNYNEYGNYDALNRVKDCTDHKGNTVRYGYDELGNRISVTYPGGEIVRYEYYKNGWLKSVTDNKNRKTEYIYDENGRLKTTRNANGTTEERSYDLAGQLTDISVTKGYSTLSSSHYEYDGRGNIVKETTGNGDSTRDLSSLTTIAMEYDKDNKLITYNEQHWSGKGKIPLWNIRRIIKCQ